MKVYLAGLDTGEEQGMEESMEELGLLAEACDMEVVGSLIQRLPEVNKALYIGQGKVEELKEKMLETEAECAVFDNALSPSQLRNLQNELESAVMDRTTLILEIFASRAKTKEAMLQVETARLQYILPRLAGLGTALSRQGGGSGSRSNKGAGEKKLELDRRRLEHRLSECRSELKLLTEKRKTQRKLRMESAIPKVALVGYTNAGKSTLLNAMLDCYTKKEEDAEHKKVMAKDMLFATLDTTVRKICPSNQPAFLLSDTVGFISKLPHDLIEAFQSTLEETKEADLILEVVDASDVHHKEHVKVTEETLNRIGSGHVNRLYVYNKADKIMDEKDLPLVREDRIYLSAEKGIGFPELLQLILNKLAAGFVSCTMKLPFERGDLESYFTGQGAVKAVRYDETGIELDLYCSVRDYDEYRKYVI